MRSTDLQSDCGYEMLSDQEAMVVEREIGRGALPLPEGAAYAVRLTYNPICMRCTRLCKDCAGTHCKVWDGCVYRIPLSAAVKEAAQ